RMASVSVPAGAESRLGRSISATAMSRACLWADQWRKKHAKGRVIVRFKKSTGIKELPICFLKRTCH
ncbi:MAG TPA: hypothetical protein VK638_50875, partial [Edaphobacter sp.]|nr:hypothetical protein [Edaphobacter sp.]